MPVETATYVNDLVATYPEHGNPKAEGDNHLRLIKEVLQATFPNLGGPLLRKIDKSADYTVTPTDTTAMFNCTAAMVLAFEPAADLGASHVISVYANGGAVTLNPDGAELINGAATLVIPSGTFILVYCTGTGFFAVTLKEPIYEAFKVGAIYTTVSPTNPATSLGYGTWVAFATGKALVGIDPANTLMDAVEETFGSANSVNVSHTHTATVTDPGHRHGGIPTSTGAGDAFDGDGAFSGFTSFATTGISVSIASSGETGVNKNYQPSIAVYFWKRTA